MNWQKIAEAIPRDAKNISKVAQIDSAQVCRSWNECAARFLLDGAMRAHEAINFRDGLLTVSVTDATYLIDIRYQQRKIVRSVNQALGTNLVQTVRYLA